MSYNIESEAIETFHMYIPYLVGSMGACAGFNIGLGRIPDNG